MIVNPDKSQLKPTQSLKHLGFEYIFKKAKVKVVAKTVAETTVFCQNYVESYNVRLPCLESLKRKIISEKHVPY